MTTQETHGNQTVAQYRARLLKESVIEHHIERRFTPVKDSGGFPPDIARAYSNLLRAREPVIEDLLRLPSLVVLAEPGAGKSTVARAAITVLAGRTDIVPIRVSLLECSATRSLPTLIASALKGTRIEGQDQRFYYVLDGLDEIPREFLGQMADEIRELLQNTSTAGMLATSRQAFYVAHREILPEFHSVFYLLDFSNNNIHAYLKMRNVDREVFIAETQRLAFFDEIRNPFNLKHAVDMYLKSSRLPSTRSDLLEYIVRSQLHTRQEISGFRQQRALEQLAVAMEIYARNELTEDEAIQVIRQSIHGVTVADARDLLNTLYSMILKRTEGGLAFQLASYGEYLAAYSLASEPLERFKQIAFDQGGTPNASWLNTVSYLAELNGEVREYFCRWHPLWVLNVSPSALNNIQRDDVVEATLRLLKTEHMHVVDHPQVRRRQLARLVTPAMKQKLLQLLGSTDGIEKSNALALLGMTGATEVVGVALDLVTERQTDPSLRYAAIVALANTESEETAPRLLASLQADDPYHLNIVDVIGTAATIDQLPQVLPVLLQTSGMPSSAYYRFQELHSREAVVTLLHYAIAHVMQVNTMRAEIYFEPVFSSVSDHFDDEVAGLCADLLSLIELQHFYLDRSGPIYKFFYAFRNAEDAHRERLMVGFFQRISGRISTPATTFLYTSDIIGGLMTVGAARWLVEHQETQLIALVSGWVRGDARTYLSPHSGGIIAAQDAAREQHFQQEEQRRESSQNRIETLQASLITRTTLNEALGDFVDLTKEHWPPLTAAYIEWLTAQVNARLYSLNLSAKIVWQGQSVTHPWELNILLDVVAFYGLTVADARPLVWALIAWCYDTIVRYFKDHSLADAEWTEVVCLIDQPPSPHVRDHVVQFLGSITEFPTQVRDALTRLAENPVDHGYSQADACTLVAKGHDDAWLLQRVASGVTIGVRNSAESELIRRQHEPTILAKFQEAIRNPGAVGSDNYFPPRDIPEWLTQVTAPFAWEKLVVLRKRSLELELHGLAAQCTDQLFRIDASRAIQVLKDQLKFAPTSWQIRQRAIILEQQQQIAVKAAQAAPFANVLSKLKFNTSSTRIKIWCEGINDEEIFKTLIERMADTPVDVAVGNVHGWPGLQQVKDPNEWLTQCNEAVIIMDGDNGRKLKKAKQPLTNLARTEQAKLRGFPITLVVLNKYGIENYFTQAAMEAVIGGDLSAYFPIPDAVPIQEHFATGKKTLRWRVRKLAAKIFELAPPSPPSLYPKSRNHEVAQHLHPEDIRGTDLYDVMETILKSSKRLQGES